VLFAENRQLSTQLPFELRLPIQLKLRLHVRHKPLLHLSSSIRLLELSINLRLPLRHKLHLLPLDRTIDLKFPDLKQDCLNTSLTMDDPNRLSRKRSLKLAPRQDPQRQVYLFPSNNPIEESSQLKYQQPMEQSAPKPNHLMLRLLNQPSIKLSLPKLEKPPGMAVKLALRPLMVNDTILAV
jgi:hypothetical protein